MVCVTGDAFSTGYTDLLGSIDYPFRIISIIRIDQLMACYSRKHMEDIDSIVSFAKLFPDNPCRLQLSMRKSSTGVTTPSLIGK